MALSYVIKPLPEPWPGKPKQPKHSPFKTKWTGTLDLLDRELRHLGARNVVLHVDVRHPNEIRQDGQLRADARPAHRIMLAFSDKNGKRLQFPCDTFAWWQDNVYAIARALEALRMVERYGVSSTSQYEGFKALPASTGPTMDVETAAVILSNYKTTLTDKDILRDKRLATEALRAARAKEHPDVGGDASRWHNVELAKRILEAHHGGSL